jgi:hypothetical protein
VKTKAINRDRISSSLKAVFGARIASAFNFKLELENSILIALRTFEFSHSLGHKPQVKVSPGNVCSAQGQLRTHAPQQREKVLEKPDALFARSRHLGQCAIAAKTSATKVWVSGVHAESLYRPRQQIALLSQVPSGGFRVRSARRLVPASGFRDSTLLAGAMTR